MSGQLLSDLTTGQLAQELRKPIIRKCKKIKVQSSFTDNIWAVDLAGLQLIIKVNEGIRFLLCVIYIYSKYAWVFSLKYKKTLQVPMLFRKLLKESDRKSKKIWVDEAVNFIIAQ